MKVSDERADAVPLIADSPGFLNSKHLFSSKTSTEPPTLPLLGCLSGLHGKQLAVVNSLLDLPELSFFFSRDVESGSGELLFHPVVTFLKGQVPILTLGRCLAVFLRLPAPISAPSFYHMLYSDRKTWRPLSQFSCATFPLPH